MPLNEQPVQSCALYLLTVDTYPMSDLTEASPTCSICCPIGHT